MKRLAVLAVLLVTIGGSCGINQGNIDRKHPLPVHCRRQVGATCIGATPGPELAAWTRPLALNCPIAAHGSGGRDSFTLHVTSNKCNLKVKAETQCWPILLPGRYWVSGNVITSPGISVAGCGQPSVYTRPYGYEWKPNLTAPYLWRFVGPGPPRTPVHEPADKCKPYATSANNGSVYTVIFKRNPCRMRLRAAIYPHFFACHSCGWEFGTVSVARYRSRSSVMISRNATDFFNWGFEWRQGRGPWTYQNLGPNP